MLKVVLRVKTCRRHNLVLLSPLSVLSVPDLNLALQGLDKVLPSLRIDDQRKQYASHLQTAKQARAFRSIVQQLRTFAPPVNRIPDPKRLGSPCNLAYRAVRRPSASTYHVRSSTAGGSVAASKSPTGTRGLGL